MRSFSLRLTAALVFGITLVSLASSWYEVKAGRAALHNELERKADSFGESFAGNAELLLPAGDPSRLQALVEKFSNRDHLAGAAVFDRDGKLLAATTGLRSAMPALVPLLRGSLERSRVESEYMRLRFRRLYLLTAPLHAPDKSIAGGMVLVYDADYIRTETFRLWSRAFIHLAVQVLVIAAITLLIVRWSLIQPIAKAARWIRDLRTGHHPSHAPLQGMDFLFPLTREMAPLAAGIQQARAAAEEEARLRNSGDSLWTAQRLSDHVRSKLDGASLFVVSNREPWVHIRQGERIVATVPASGLVTALEPVLCACRGTWIAYGSGDADIETVDSHDRLQVPPHEPRYTLRRVWLSVEEVCGYYDGFANEGLWPLCHIAHTRPLFRASDWKHYIEVNQKFADALVEEIGEKQDPVILIQDYHFALLPGMIKDRLPHARVAIFWHIPWPNPESFGICPWQRELLDGLLGADLIGFHVQAHCNNFLNTVDRVLEARVNWERFSVKRNDHWSTVRPFPISVDFADESAGPAADAAAETASLKAELGIEASVLALGVDRLDYTKGIIERFQAVELFLENYPVYQGKFTLLQIGAPSRTRIRRYADFQDEVEAEANRINSCMRRGRWQPIVLLNHHHDHEDLQRFYRASDVCMVTSLHDGMNLVAKEFAAAQQSETGVLILSRFTGAARELRDAIIVNPYDIQSTADAVASALTMDLHERIDRMRHMRRWIREHNIFWWAGTLIGELCDLRLPRANRTGMPDANGIKVETQAVTHPR